MSPQYAVRLAARAGFALLAGCVFPLFNADAPNVEPAVEPTGTQLRRELRVSVLDEPFDVVTVARTEGALRFHIATQKLCQTDVLRSNDTTYSDGRVERGVPELESSRRNPCDALPQPAAAVDIGLQAGPRLMVLGTSSQSGDFALSLSQLDALFADRPVELGVIGQILVHGRKAAELPLGEILNRQQLIEATLAACDQALAAPSTTHEQLETRLAELMELKQQAADDPRLLERAHRLFERLHARGGSTEDRTALAGRSSSESQDFDRVLRALPTMCKITVQGGQVVIGTLVSEGFALAMVLGVISSEIGDDLTEWLTNRCCEMAASSILHAESTVCNTAPKSEPPPALTHAVTQH